MKKTRKTSNSDVEMKSEYDLSSMKGGVRGKYAHAYRSGHSVRVTHKDGSVTVKNYTLKEGAVVLAPDVQQYFPDSESVNEALRCLIPLVSKRQRSRSKAKPAHP
jgi:hypothetical protein